MIRSGFLRCTVFIMAAGFVPAAPQQANTASDASQAQANKALIDKYCVSCHNEKLKTGGRSFENLDLANVAVNAETLEKIIRKMHTGSMPPQGMPRPDKATLDGLANSLAVSLDRAAAANPNPGRATLHRLNRTEYANAIKEILGLNIDAAALLPNDDESYGFDNIADVLKTSPILIERYMSASWNISRLAVGGPAMGAGPPGYRAKPDLSQDDHLEGLPLGTRGGLKFTHNFQLDGDYIFRVRMWRATTDIIRGLKYANEVEYSIDGVRAGLVRIGGRADERASEDNSGTSATDLDQRLTVRVPVKAGPHEVVITFLKKTAAQEDDILQPFLRSNVDPVGYQGQTSVDRVSVNGPL